MTQEERQLVFIDLCARLPHNVICQFTWTYCNETTDGEEVIAKENDNIRNIDVHTKEIQADYYCEWVDLENCKPYLRPMSSMTEEEKKIMSSYGFELIPYDTGYTGFANIENYIDEVSFRFMEEFLNSHHFDYRGLIPIGLALEAKEGMYKSE